MKSQFQNIDYPDKLVAFLDILGFQRLVLQDKDNALKSINFIDEKLNHVLKEIYEAHGKSFSAKLFSDCICLSCENTVENLFYILYELAYIQLYFSFEGIFVRGALSRGNHFENERIIFSRGLIAAYNLERSAVYPRIIIDSELIEQIKRDNNSYAVIQTEFKKTDFIMQSPDEHFMVDYLHFLYEEGMEQIDDLKKHKQSILRQVQQNKDNIKVLEKYRWLAEYHNFKFKEIFDDQKNWEESYGTEVIKDTSIDLVAIFPKFNKVSANKSIETDRE